MAKVIFTLLFITITFNFTLGQKFSPKLETLMNQFKTFNYNSAIQTADSMLVNVNGLTTTDLCEIYRMKGTAHYSLMDMTGALSSFIELLKLNPSYQMDSTYNSPKIIVFFEEIRGNFQPQSITNEVDSPLVKLDTLVAIHNQAEVPSNYKKAAVFSLIAPGSGHITSGMKTKGWILLTISGLSMGTGIYYTVETNKLEDKYLQAYEKNEIKAKYDAYNKTYKKRNVAFLSFGIIWLYTQIDFLLLSDLTCNDDLQLSLKKDQKHLLFSLTYNF
jgi:hypothetical protein